MAKKKEIIEETEVEAPIETPEVVVEETPAEEVVVVPEVETETPEPETEEVPKAEATPATKCECDGVAVVVRNRGGSIKVCQDCGKKK